MTFERIKLTDTHCHLNLPEFEEDLPEVIQRAVDAGVTRILIPGLDLESSRRAVNIAEEYNGVFAAIGVHPHNASAWDPSTEKSLIELSSSKKVVAIGEIGLDYYRNLSARDAQTRVFRTQLALAGSLQLPVVIHNRDSIDDVLRLISDWTSSPSEKLQDRRGVLHSFSADKDSAARVVELGFFLGISGPITYRNAHERRQITLGLPQHRMLIETDSPYLTPEPYRGKRNEPANVQLVAAQISSLFGLDLNEVAEYTTNNAETLFKWNDGREDSGLL